MEKQIRLLLVDDNKEYVDCLFDFILSEMFSQIEYIDVAYDGSEAVLLLEKKKFNWILMDIRMPFMNGIEATMTIRNLYPDVRIIALSMLSDSYNIKQMLDAGAIAHIAKEDFTILQLGTIINQYQTP